MMKLRYRRQSLFLLLGATIGFGCAADTEKDEAVQAESPTFEEFRAKYHYEPALDRYVIEGDLLASEDRLRSYYDAHVALSSAHDDHGDIGEQHSSLIVDNKHGTNTVWPSTQALNLSYCVSNNFGVSTKGNHAKVVTAMQNAANRWQQAANIRFVYNSARNGDCTNSNSNVVFNVVPFEFSDLTLASAFFPDGSRADRQLLIDSSSFTYWGGLESILTHELGHVLGFRHENTRYLNAPDANGCRWEDANWQPLTGSEPTSAMYCGNSGGFLTDADRNGAACAYGAAPGFSGGCPAVRGVTYHTHVQDLGWLPWVQNNDISGTQGKGLRIEAVQMTLRRRVAVSDQSAQICYSAHVEGIGWQTEVCGGATAGTTGQARRVEAVRVRMVNPPAGCSVTYQAHVEGIGWQAPVSNNGVAGTTGQSRRLEALRVSVSDACTAI